MVILGLGSNVGDRMAHLTAAIRALAPLLQNMKCSGIFESEAVLPPDATPDMNRPFYNMAVAGECMLAPGKLLSEIKSLEIKLGRIERCQWGPREIDIDILAWDEQILESGKLNIPHKELLNRDFALVPLAEIAPEWKYPLAGNYYHNSVAEIIRKKDYGLNDSLRDTGLTIHV